MFDLDTIEKLNRAKVTLAVDYDTGVITVTPEVKAEELVDIIAGALEEVGELNIVAANTQAGGAA